MQTDKQANRFQRSRNVSRNILFGMLNRFFALLMPFIVRTVLIYRFGAVYLGMNSLFLSIFRVLNLAELGFGSAIVYCLYRSVAEEDTETVCAYLGSFRKIYRGIGCVILLLGLSVIPFLPYLLKNSAVPADMNVFVWYLIFLADAAASYLLFGYKTVIPTALQRNDLISKIDTTILIAKSGVQLVFLLCSDNFYFYLLSTLFFTVVRNFVTSWMVEQRFPQYVCRGSISEVQFADLRRRVGGLALAKVRTVSRNSLDNICITAFISLTMTAIYDNYFVIHTAVISVINIARDAMVPSVGNSIAMETSEKNYRDMRRFDFMYMLPAGWATICLLCLYQPFVMLWMGPQLMLGYPEVFGLCLYFYILKMGDIRWVYFEAAGLWWHGRYVAVTEIIMNLVLNVLLGSYWGVPGIIVATLLSLFFVNYIWSAWILFRQYFCNDKLHEFFTDHLRYFAVTLCIAFLSFNLCERVVPCHAGTDTLAEGIAALFYRICICTGISGAEYFFIYRNSEQYLEAKHWLVERYRAFRGYIL